MFFEQADTKTDVGGIGERALHWGKWATLYCSKKYKVAHPSGTSKAIDRERMLRSIESFEDDARETPIGGRGATSPFV